MIFKLILAAIILLVLTAALCYGVFHVVTWFFSRDFFGENRYFDDSDKK